MGGELITDSADLPDVCGGPVVEETLSNQVNLISISLLSEKSIEMETKANE